MFRFSIGQIRLCPAVFYHWHVIVLKRENKRLDIVYNTELYTWKLREMILYMLCSCIFLLMLLQYFHRYIYFPSRPTNNTHGPHLVAVLFRLHYQFGGGCYYIYVYKDPLVNFFVRKIFDLAKYLLNSLNNIDTWQLSLQLSCGDTCQI